MYDSGLMPPGSPFTMQSDMMNRNNMNNRLTQIEHEVMAHKAQAMMNSSGPTLRPMTPPAAPSKEQADMLASNHKLITQYTELMKSHTELMTMHRDLVNNEAASKPVLPRNSKGLRKQVTLGIIRLDYDYPAAPGDIDCPDSYGYHVIYRVVPGFTFGMCQSGKMTREVEDDFIAAVRFLENQGVSGITGDCGFMMYFQTLARQHTKKPVFMSALAQLPAIVCSFARDELIAIFTANSTTLKPMRNLIKDECGVDPEERRFIMVGCQDVPGFEAVAAGDKVDVAKVTPGMIKKARETVKQYPQLRGFLLECTELPPYADAIRSETGLPVYDAITACDYFMMGLQDNKRFGLDGWQETWDGKQETYSFGAHLSAADRAKLVNK